MRKKEEKLLRASKGVNVLLHVCNTHLRTYVHAVYAAILAKAPLRDRLPVAEFLKPGDLVMFHMKVKDLP